MNNNYDFAPSFVWMMILLALLFITLVWVAFPFIVNSKANQIIKLLQSIDARLQKEETIKASNQRLSYSKCPCYNCGQPVEFLTAHAGETVNCPHCKTDTLLFVPKVA